MNLDRLDNPECCLSPTVSGNGLTVAFSPSFEPDWHPFHGERLAVFPRFVLLKDSGLASDSCWPDLSTFTENDAERQIAYYPAGQSARSLRLVFERRTSALHVAVYEDDRTLLQALVSNASDTELEAA